MGFRYADWAHQLLSGNSLLRVAHGLINGQFAYAGVQMRLVIHDNVLRHETLAGDP